MAHKTNNKEAESHTKESNKQKYISESKDLNDFGEILDKIDQSGYPK
jgi:hypothetical protein